MNALLLLGLLTLVGSIVVSWMLEDRICGELRARHPEIWRALGSAERVFDDFGLARWTALERLWKNTELLAVCGPGLTGRHRLRRKISRVCVAGACILLLTGVVYYLGMND